MLGENGSNTNHGLANHSNAVVMLRGGSFTGRGGEDAWGILNDFGTLEAKSITALGENGSDTNMGLYTFFSLTNITQSILGGATNSVVGLNDTISNSRLVGGTVGGTVTCVAVSHGTTFYPSSCP